MDLNVRTRILDLGADGRVCLSVRIKKYRQKNQYLNKIEEWPVNTLNQSEICQRTRNTITNTVNVPQAKVNNFLKLSKWVGEHIVTSCEIQDQAF